MKRKIVLILSFLLLFMMIPATSFAEMRTPYAILNTTEGSLIISYDFLPDDVDSDEILFDGEAFDYADWISYPDDILTVTIDESMKNCDSVVSTAWWFSGLYQITEIGGLEYLDTSNVTSMVSMFQDSTGLTSLDLSTFDTTNVLDMQGMFWGCSNLETLDLSSFDTTNCGQFSSIFQDCSKLKTIYASNNFVMNDTAKSKSQCIFHMCNELTGDFGTKLTDAEYDTEDEAISLFRLDTLSNPGLFSTGNPFEVTNLKVSALEVGQKISNATITGTVKKDGIEIKGTWKFVKPDTVITNTDFGTTEYTVEFIPAGFTFRKGDEIFRTVKIAKKEATTPSHKKSICQPHKKATCNVVKSLITVVVVKVTKIIRTLCRLW